jgi:hypothetical protein
LILLKFGKLNFMSRAEVSNTIVGSGYGDGYGSGYGDGYGSGYGDGYGFKVLNAYGQGE